MVNRFSTRMPRPFNGERTVFSTSGTETTIYPHSKELSRTLPSTIYKNNSKWVIDLNVRTETVKFLHIHTVEYYSAIKRNEVLKPTKTWMNLENMLNGRSQTYKVT